DNATQGEANRLCPHNLSCFPASGRSTNAIFGGLLIERRLLLLGLRGLDRLLRHLEDRVINRRIQLDLVDNDLAHRLAFDLGFERKGEHQSVNRFVISSILFDLDFPARPLPLELEFELEIVFGIQIDISYVTVLQRELQIVNRRTFHIFLAHELDLMTLFFVVDERAVHICLFFGFLQVISGNLLGIGRSLKRIYLPTGLTVVCLDLRLALKRHVGANHVGALLLDDKRYFEALLNNFRGNFSGLDSLYFLNAAPCVEVFLYQIVNALRRRLNAKEEGEREDGCERSSDHGFSFVRQQTELKRLLYAHSFRIVLVKRSRR